MCVESRVRWLVLGAAVLLSGLLLASAEGDRAQTHRTSPTRRVDLPEPPPSTPEATEPIHDPGRFRSSLRLSVFVVPAGAWERVEWIGRTPTESGVPVEGLWGVRAEDEISLRELVEALRGSGVRALTLSRHMRAEEFALLRELPDLEWLDCDGCYGAGRATEHLGRLDRLRYLDLRSTGIDEVGLTHLAGLGSLEAISLTQTSVGESGMLALASLPRLERVRLWVVGLTVEAMRNLSRAPRLRFVELGGGGTDSSAVAGLAGHPLLESLEFNHQNDFTPETLASLQRLPALTDLRLDYCSQDNDDYFGKDFDEECFERIGGITGLQSLCLRHVGTTDAGLARLNRLSRLENLEFCDSGITDAGMKHLRHFPLLKTLTLWDVYCSDAGIEVLRELPRLEEFHLIGNNQITDAGLENLPGGLQLLSIHSDQLRTPDFSRFRDLRRLWLWDSHVGDEALKSVAGLAALRDLDLDGTPVTSAGLAHLSRLRSLRELDLNRTVVDDEGLAHLQTLEHLEYLDLGSTRVTGRGLRWLSGLTALKRLNLYRTKTTDQDLALLPPNIETLDLRNTAITAAALPHLRRLEKLDCLLVDGSDFPRMEWLGKCRVSH